MTEQETLLWAVRADPYDNLARMAYADWCDDTGRHDRADLVRYQLDPEEGWRRDVNLQWAGWNDTSAWRVTSCLLSLTHAAEEAINQMLIEDVPRPYGTTLVTVSRGFVDRVTYHTGLDYRPAALFDRQPVLGVRVRPARCKWWMDSPEAHCWVRQTDDRPWPLPDEVWADGRLPTELFVEVLRWCTPPRNFDPLRLPLTAQFANSKEAYLGLSCAMVNLGRSLRGLPRLAPAGP